MVTLTTADFGDHEGKKIKKFTWKTSSGFSVTAISYGAIIQSIKVPDKGGKVKDVVLGFDDLKSYVSRNMPYFGAVVGRCANRIKCAFFEIDGVRFCLPRNNGDHSLHGGVAGFDKKVWQTTIHSTKVIFTYLSPDKEEGYPGNVIATVSYDVTENDELLMNFTATTDQKTVVNLVNHSYFNLAGHESGAEELYKHLITMNADKITEPDPLFVTTGRFKDVGGTPFDLRTPTKLGDAMKKAADLFDQNFCISTHGKKGLNFVSRVVHPPSGRTLEIYSDQPGCQLYTGNFLNAPSDPLKGKDGAGYKKHGAFCLETQNYPNAVHHANFPSAVLKPGDVYKHAIVFKFGVDKGKC